MAVMEPTDEMLDAHEQARRAYWANLGHDTGEGGMTATEHERVAQRQAMKAALAVVERDYKVVPREIWGRKAEQRQLCDAQIPRLFGHGEAHCELQAGHSAPHRDGGMTWSVS